MSSLTFDEEAVASAESGSSVGLPGSEVDMDVEYNESKFTEMVLYVAERLRDDRAGGATKLSKLLYFADFAHVRRTGRPITGAEYQRLGRGPAPRRLLPVRQRLVERGDAAIVREDFLGYEQHRLLPRRQPDLSVFSDDELSTIDKVIADLDSLTATQVSDLSHEEPGWQLSGEGQTIAYETALIAKRQVSTPTSRRLGAEIAQRYDLSVER